MSFALAVLCFFRKMVTRHLVSVCLIVLVLGAGCLSGQPSGASPTDTQIRVTSTESASPSVQRPANLTDATVVDYATTYERAVLYNKVSEPGAEVSLSCNARLVNALPTDSGYYVAAACGGSVTYPDNSHGDIGTIDHFYFINNSTTIRIEPTILRNIALKNAYKADNESENLYSRAAYQPVGFEILNFAAANHTTTVHITYLNDTSQPRMFAQTYRIGGHSGAIQRYVTARKGTYNISVRLATGETATFRWQLSDVQHRRATIIITPDGEVQIQYIPGPRMV